MTVFDEVLTVVGWTFFAVAGLSISLAVLFGATNGVAVMVGVLGAAFLVALLGLLKATA
jgi:hypothetical protein